MVSTKCQIWFLTKWLRLYPVGRIRVEAVVRRRYHALLPAFKHFRRNSPRIPTARNQLSVKLVRLSCVTRRSYCNETRTWATPGFLSYSCLSCLLMMSRSSPHLSPDPTGGLTFQSQDKLPKLPIPDLKETCDKYLAALVELQVWSPPEIWN